VSRPQVISDQDHERVHEKVAAIDVAKDSGVVCTRTPHRSRSGVRQAAIWTVRARTGAIRELGQQLARDGIELVTLESTSDYWRIWFFVLEACGLAVQLVSASQAKNLPGRPKTDLLTELTDRSLGWCVRTLVILARFRPRDQRRGYAAGVVRAGGAASRLA